MPLLHLSKSISFLFSTPKLFKSPIPIPMATLSSSMASTPNPKPRLRGVVFDMDGTLTVPVIDFPAMYQAVLGQEEYLRIRAESPSGIDILHQIENWSPEKQQKAYQTIADFERQGLDRLQIMPGAAELCGYLDSKRIREFRPYKPDPAPLLHICSVWDVQPDEVIMVGDSLKDDVRCGKEAGAFTCLLDETGRYDSPEYANVDHKPDFKVSSLVEIHTLLESKFHLEP